MNSLKWSKKIRLNLNRKCNVVYNHEDKHILGANCAVDDEVDGAVDDEGEVLDGGQSEHPAGVDWHQAQLPAEVGPTWHAWLKSNRSGEVFSEND